MARKSPFTNRQLSRIVVLWAQHQSLAKVRREFAKEFHLAKHPRLVPSMTVFRNTITRFNETASAKPNSGGGSKMSVRTPQNILRVKDAIDEDKTLSVRALSLQLDIDQTTVWRILRKDLMMFPYKAKTTTSLLPGSSPSLVTGSSPAGLSAPGQPSHPALPPMTTGSGPSVSRRSGG